MESGDILFLILSIIIGAIRTIRILVIVIFLIFLISKKKTKTNKTVKVNKGKEETFAKLLSDEIIVAADKGEEEAKKKLNEAFKSGLSSDTHNKLRKKAYYPLAMKGDSNAQYWMGFLAISIEKDTQKAIEWYEKAASQGNTEAMLDLANRYSEFWNDEDSLTIGFGFDAVKERFWKVKAAENGNPEAQVSLALDYSIEGNNEKSLQMYQLAASCSDCKILLKAYSGMATIYGNSQDEGHYNVQLQEECLIRVLEMKQNHVNDARAYDESAYGCAAFSLGALYQNKYEKSKNPIMLKRSVYCFVLAFTCGNEFVQKYIEKSGYEISEQEMSEWQKHARTLSFYLPE